jgi:PAS domain S-box-containing protein
VGRKAPEADSDASASRSLAGATEGAAQAAAATDSEERYHSLFQTGVAAVLLLDLQGRIVEANAVAVAAAGCPKEVLVGTEISRYLPPGAAANVQRAIRAVLRGRSLQFETDTVGGDGCQRCWRVAAGPVRIGSRVTNVVVTAVDLTGEKRALAALAASEERYRMVERATDNVIWEWRVRDDTAHFSENLLAVFGYPGGHKDRAFQWWRERVHPDDLEEVAHREFDALQRGEQTYRVEYRFRRANGEYAWIVDTGFMVLDAKGNLERVVGSFRDATREKEAQAALAASEERFRLAQQATNDVVFEIDFAKDECVASDSLVDILGYPGGRYTNAQDWWRKRVHPDDYEGVLAAQKRSIETGDLVPNEYRIRRADGSWAVVRTRGFIVRDAQGNPVRMLATLADITEQKAAEQALRDGKRMLETVLERLPVGVLIAEAPSGRPLTLNRSLIQILGRRAPSRNWREYTGIGACDTSGRPLSAEEYPVAKALLSGRPVYGDVIQIPRTGGGLKPIKVDAVPVRDDAGRLVAVVGVVADVTDQLRREAWLNALAEAGRASNSNLGTRELATRLLRAAVPVVADYCSLRLFGSDGTQQFVLAENRYPDRDGIVREIVERLAAGEMPRPIEQVLEKGEPMLIEDGAENALRHGLSRDLTGLIQQIKSTSAVLVPVRSEDRTVGVVSFVMADSGRRYSRPDVPYATRYAEQMWLALENARLYADLQVSDRAKGTFLATLGHELRNPLAGIRNAVEVLRLTMSPDPATTPTLETLDRQARVMTRLVDDLLDVSRIESGKLTLRCEILDLRRVLRDAIETVRPLLSAKQHVLEEVFPSEPVPVDGDPVRLAQVFGNILHNSAKFTPDFGSIRVSLRTLEDNVEVVIQDNGAGIEEEFMPRLFDLFVQAPETSGRRQEGLGIGLPLAKQLVQMHGGTISASSDGAGRGCSVTVTLPLVRPYGAPNEPHQVVAESRAARRILIVDDNVDAAESLSRILKVWGHEARCVFDAASALKATEQADFDGWNTIVLDIGLPDLDGFELARRLRAAGFGGRIIAVTGYGEDSDRERSLTAGIDAHLVKPVDFCVLEAAITGQGEDA